jgi:hypothetical protein
MYKTSVEYFRSHQPNQTIYSQYQGPQPKQHVYQGPQPKQHVYQGPLHKQHVYQEALHKQHVYQGPQPKQHVYQEALHKHVQKSNDNANNSINTTDPSVWGPLFWFTLHNGASTYPLIANKIYRERMKGFIKGIPVMLPCVKCSGHAFEYINKNLDDIVSGRIKLFKFFIDFHNMVNKRHNKKEMSYDDVFAMYSLSE